MGFLDLRGGLQIGDFIDCKPALEGTLSFIGHNFRKDTTIGKCPRCGELGFVENETMFIHVVQVVGNKLPTGQLMPMLSVFQSCNPKEEPIVSSVLSETV